MEKEINVLKESNYSSKILALKSDVKNMKTNREVPGSGKVQNSTFELAAQMDILFSSYEQLYDASYHFVNNTVKAFNKADNTAANKIK